MTTIISQNLKKTSERIDPAGNIINPSTKQIIKAIEPEFVAPVTAPSIPIEAPQTPINVVTVQSGGLSIQEQIDAAKANLAKLQELKKLKIQEMEAELELLKQ